MRHNLGFLNCLLLTVALVGCELPVMQQLNSPVDQKSGAYTTFKLTYNANGGTGTTPATVTLTPGLVVTLADGSGLTQTLSVFNGWNTKADGTGTAYAAGAALTVGSANITLFAQWLSTFTVTYDGNGATSGSAPLDSKSYQAGSAVTVQGNTGLLAQTRLQGSGTSTWVGWNTAADGTGTSYKPGVSMTFTMGTGNVTLFAQWTQTSPYYVTYLANGATGGSVPVDSSSYLYIAPPSSAMATIRSNSGTLVRTGFQFSGWNTRTDGTGTSYAATGAATLAIGTMDVVLYSKWVPTYTVSYSANLTGFSGSPPTDATKYVAGQTAKVLGNEGVLSFSGFYFLKWNTQQDGSGTNYVFGSSLVMGANNLTLYAQWAQLPAAAVSSTSGLAMVYVPGGTFYNGTANMTVSSFRMGRTDVTQAQVSSVGDSWGVNHPGANYPQELITWYQAVAYCNQLSIHDGLTPVYSLAGATNPSSWGTAGSAWDVMAVNTSANGYRLPTEAEYMWAAMGGNNDSVPGTFTNGVDVHGYTKAFAGSNGSNAQANYAGGYNVMANVAGLLPNEVGLYDMSGNIAKWVWDWSASYPSTDQTNYMGPASGTSRVVKSEPLTGYTLNTRSLDAPNSTYPPSQGGSGLPGYGFRIARSYP